MLDPRNRPAFYGSILAGLVVFFLLWFLGLGPLVAWLTGWSIPAFAMYGIDKRQAQSGGWRVPEAVLHGLALIGGVVGAWAGRAVFRHKTQKTIFTVVLVAASILWAVVAALWLAGVPAQAHSQAGDALAVTDVDGNAISIEDTSRVATLGGVFTETAYALGAQDQVVAVDASSFYPPEALKEKPNFGYYRFLSAEPVLAQAPSLIIGNEETGPPEVVAQLRDAGIPVLLLPDHNDVPAARDLITTLGTVFGREAAAADLVATFDADVAAAQALVAGATSRPRVLFVLQPPEAPLLVAGGDTAAGSMIDLAGGENLYPGFGSYIPMTPEGIVESAPDIILTTDASLERLGGREAFLAMPGIAQTAAAQAGRVVSMDDLYLMGFGPRTGKAIADLARLLHPELAS